MTWVSTHSATGVVSPLVPLSADGMGCFTDGVSHTVPSHENCASVNTLQLVLCLSVGKLIFAGTAAAASAADGRGRSGCTCAGNSRYVVTYQDNTIIPKESGTS